ncbi:MAG: DUF4340 domain-containing protein [Candidatus Gracilibacteria bacterium]
MSKKQLVVLTLLFIAIVSVAVFQKYVDNASYSPKNEKFLSVNTGLVDRVTLTMPSKEIITLSKTGTNWDITTPINSRADNEKVNTILNEAKNIVTTGTISTNKDKFDEFQVNEKGTHVEFFQNNEKKAGFYIGKISDDYVHTYARKDTEDTTYLAKGILQGSFQTPLVTLRDKTVTKLKPEEVSEIIFKSDTDKLTLSNTNNVWSSTPKSDVANEIIQSTVMALLSINAENILENSPIKREDLLSSADLKLFIRRTNPDLKSVVLYLKSQDSKLYAAEESSQNIFELNSILKDEITKVFK